MPGVAAGKHKRSAAAIGIQEDVKRQLAQQGALRAASGGGLQDGSAGEEEEEDIVSINDTKPPNLSQFGRAFKVPSQLSSKCCLCGTEVVWSVT